jgi:DNA-binding MarR family transcriptional regulator
MAKSEYESGPASDQVARLAAVYKARYPWADLASADIAMRIYSAAASSKAAQVRFFKVNGIERSHARYTVLRLLFFSDGRPVSQREIGEQTRATSANITYLIDGLEREGLVERVQDPQDKRFSYVRLTPAGHELAAMLVPKMVQHMNELLENFTPEEKQEFIRLLEKYERNAEASYQE